jgi:two-component system, OmpR family, alkaline phosphatase synthesis response regulator PhoP
VEQLPKILLVDDDEDILEFLGYNLKREGYEVEKANNGPDAIKLALKNPPDLIVLDVMMPGMDGIEVCNLMRQEKKLNHSRIAFLTARGEDYSQIAGFDAGGDDYIVKPISPKVFIVRVKALLKRSSAQTAGSDTRLIIANLIIDREKYIVFKEDVEISLPRKEFEMLYLLASKPNKVFSRDEIFSKIWGEDILVGMRTIDVHMRMLREKLDIPNLKTIKGVGYKFELK